MRRGEKPPSPEEGSHDGHGGGVNDVLKDIHHVLYPTGITNDNGLTGNHIFNGHRMQIPGERLMSFLASPLPFLLAVGKPMNKRK
jgi:hypothetical protein